MQLQLYDSEEDKLVCELEDDSATLGSTGARNGWRINVVDKDPSKKQGEFEDLSQVKKYEMKKEDYAKRTGEHDSIPSPKSCYSHTLVMLLISVVSLPLPLTLSLSLSFSPQTQLWPSRSG